MRAKAWRGLGQQGLARAGELITSHGVVPTPVFMPVGTQATVKALAPADLERAGASLILANTYHLHLRPGEQVISQFKGLHRFMNWPGAILTDSGGYQVSSLGWFKKAGTDRLVKITDEGADFVSHLDGSKHFLSPEKAIQIQLQLGADIIMAFDEATPNKGKDYARAALRRTNRWLTQSVQTWRASQPGQGKRPHLFGIIQGGNYPELRREAAKWVIQSGVAGVALGGATIGQSVTQTQTNAAWVMEIIRQTTLPLYLMGVGVAPSHLIGAVQAGADMVDCVAPTKLARCGLLYVGQLVIPAGQVKRARFESEYRQERLDISKKGFETDQRPVEAKCDCDTCQQGFSRAYLHHLFKARELLYYRLASIHNVRMMIRTAELLRQAILCED
ncbi:hypothetical protein A2W24_04540 [Microgenomates group bacterium RBG_16_45_19]|nr:MAG: hypothetical protein A2W24_04540 [Microgenomates group bacterium RBG_16_45_19]